MNISKDDLVTQLSEIENKNYERDYAEWKRVTDSGGQWKKGRKPKHKKYTKYEAEEMITDLCDTIVNNIAIGNTVDIRGFGCFDLITRAARPCTTVQGKHIIVDEHLAAKFFPGAALKRAARMCEDSEKRGII